MPKKARKTSLKQVTLPIKWHVPDDIISRFATNMTIQTLEGVFKISFFEAKPEIRIQPKENPPSDVRADCVASIIIAPEKLPGIIEALQKHSDSFSEFKKQSQPK
jgi:hypothetical protein